jgi:hypothetical protein
MNCSFHLVLYCRLSVWTVHFIPEAEFLDEIQKEVLRVFLLATVTFVIFLLFYITCVEIRKYNDGIAIIIYFARGIILLFFISVCHFYSCQSHRSGRQIKDWSVSAQLNLLIFFYCNIRRKIKEIWTQAPSGGKQANPVESFLFICYSLYHSQWCSSQRWAWRLWVPLGAIPLRSEPRKMGSARYLLALSDC